MPKPTPRPELRDLTRIIQSAIGRALQAPRTAPGARLGEACLKADGSLVTNLDLALQAELSRGLAGAWPGVPVLGEESEAAESLPDLTPEVTGAPAGSGNQDRTYWCLDPLDGTSNFVAGFPAYAVSVALVDAMGPRLGVVHDLARNETFAAARGHGAWRDGQPLETGPGEDLPRRLDNAMALVDLKRLPRRLASRVATEHPFRSQRNIGSSALEWCWLAAGRCHLYLHGAQRPWDYAAGMLILAEAGGSYLLDPPLGPDGLLGTTPRAVIAATSPSLLSAWNAWIQRVPVNLRPAPGGTRSGRGAP